MHSSAAAGVDVRGCAGWVGRANGYKYVYMYICIYRYRYRYRYMIHMDR